MWSHTNSIRAGRQDVYYLCTDQYNVVAPGLVDTEGNRDSGFVGSEAGNAGASATPLGARFGKPEEIAPVIVFLRRMVRRG
jgi:NAD(P)-dependent dehydrogenase (short-subunit alcohol dehydrogenase family)